MSFKFEDDQPEIKYTVEFEGDSFRKEIPVVTLPTPEDPSQPISYDEEQNLAIASALSSNGFNLPPTTESRRRILEEANRVLQSSQANPVIQENSFSVTTSVRRVPSESKIDLARTMGTITAWMLFISFTIGVLMLFTKLIRNFNIDNQFVKLIVVFEFMTRISLVNVNFGHILLQYFDKIFAFDLWFMRNLISEKGIRGRLGGKLDEYKIPILMINANVLALAFYLISFVLSTVISLIKRSDKKLTKMINSIHFIIFGATVLDLVFYSSLQVSKGLSISKTGGIVSLVLCLLSLIIIVFDLYRLIRPVMTQQNIENKQNMNAQSRFMNSGFKKDSELNDKLSLKLLNPLFIIRFVLCQYLISLF
jgi:hypothetical protein